MSTRSHPTVDEPKAERAKPGEATSRLGRYEITGRLATGGMATVYLARLDAAGGFSREFALKVVHPHLADDPNFHRRFFREATIASRIRHPNAITTIDAGEDRGYSYLVLELVDGVTLRQLLLHLSRPLSAPLSALIIAMVARGLHALHSVTDDDGERLGVVHRDLSPQNVMIDRSGRVVLIDLGLAKLERDHEATQVGVLVGKLPYMSPEQARLDPLDARSDVFALGTVAFELCTGTLPFGDAHTTATLDKLQTCDRELLESTLETHAVPQWLTDIILHCLHARPQARFTSALELAEALLHGLGETGQDETTLRRHLAELVGACGPEMVKVHPADPLPPRIVPSPPSRGHPVRWVAIGAAGVLLTMLGLRWLQPDAQTATPDTAASLTQPIAEDRTTAPTVPATPASPQDDSLARDSDIVAEDERGETDSPGTSPRPKRRSKRATELKPNPY
jgi:eukaryotic-like serine/threonine-protein kinase